MKDGIVKLRVERGRQQVTFAEIADHLFDYSERFPDDQGVVDSVARFLVAAEQVPHDHDADPHRGLPRLAMAPTSVI